METASYEFEKLPYSIIYENMHPSFLQYYPTLLQEDSGCRYNRNTAGAKCQVEDLVSSVQGHEIETHAASFTKVTDDSKIIQNNENDSTTLENTTRKKKKGKHVRIANTILVQEYQDKASSRAVPAFLQKLYTIVDDPATDAFVRWSKSGNSFLVEKHKEFAKVILPQFFKHSSYTSFIRQLNMYGFYKIPHILQGGADYDIWEFAAPHFKRGRSELLAFVNRKKSKSTENKTNDSPNERSLESINTNSLIQKLAEIKSLQTTIEKELNNLQKDNKILQQEALLAKQEHQAFEEIASKLLQFLSMTMSNNHQTETTSKIHSHGSSRTASSTVNRSSQSLPRNEDIFSSSHTLKAIENQHDLHLEHNIPYYNHIDSQAVNVPTSNIDRSHKILDSLPTQTMIDADKLLQNYGFYHMASSTAEADKLRMFPLATNHSVQQPVRSNMNYIDHHMIQHNLPKTVTYKLPDQHYQHQSYPSHPQPQDHHHYYHDIYYGHSMR